MPSMPNAPDQNFRFTSPWLDGDLSSEFRPDNLSLSIDAGGSSLLRGECYPVQLDGESPIKVATIILGRHTFASIGNCVRITTTPRSSR